MPVTLKVNHDNCKDKKVGLTIHKLRAMPSKKDLDFINMMADASLQNLRKLEEQRVHLERKIQIQRVDSSYWEAERFHTRTTLNRWYKVATKPVVDETLIIRLPKKV